MTDSKLQEIISLLEPNRVEEEADEAGGVSSASSEIRLSLFAYVGQRRDLQMPRENEPKLTGRQVTAKKVDRTVARHITLS